MVCGSDTSCTNLKTELKYTWILLIYWIFEAFMLIVWLSLGIGIAHTIAYVYTSMINEELDNSIQTYITLYFLAIAIGAQTNFNLVFVEYRILKVKRKSSLLYSILKTWPLRILAVLSLVQLLLQYQVRYGESSSPSLRLGDKVKEDVAEESEVTLRFLLALAFVAYSLGMKCRRDYRLNEIRSEERFVSPGTLKYIALFGLLYTMELCMVLLWGFPIILIGLGFRYYLFNPYLTYFGLSLMGVFMGYISSSFERDAEYRELFVNHASYPLIHGEVRCNVLLFTIVPLISKWYFRIQVHYMDFETSRKVNFILFSVNIALLIMYFVKCVFIYQFKLDEFRGARRLRNRRVEPVNLPQGINHATVEQTESSTTSTGSFSNRSSSDSSILSINLSIKRTEGRSSVNVPDSNPDNNNNNNNNNNEADNNTSSQNVEDRPTDKIGDVESYNFGPLRGPLGIMKIDKVWRNEMLKSESHPDFNG